MFSLEHSKIAYWADYLVYATAIAWMGFGVIVHAPGAHWFILLNAVTGLVAWSLIEYLIHRYVLHGIEPFKTWHASHHERPSALISAPTALSTALIALLVFAPTFLISSIWPATSLTMGVTTGYLAYAVCHHATHHWRANGAWLKERKRWHAMHHRYASGVCFGVTSTFWDRVFSSGPSRRSETP